MVSADANQLHPAYFPKALALLKVAPVFVASFYSLVFQEGYMYCRGPKANSRPNDTLEKRLMKNPKMMRMQSSAHPQNWRHSLSFSSKSRGMTSPWSSRHFIRGIGIVLEPGYPTASQLIPKISKRYLESGF